MILGGIPDSTFQAKDSQVEGVISLVLLTQNLPIQIHAGWSIQPTESSFSQKSPTGTKWFSFIRPPYLRMRVSKYLMEASCPIIGVVLSLSFGGWEIDLFCDSQSLPILRTDISLVQRTRHPATNEVFFCQQPLQHALRRFPVAQATRQKTIVQSCGFHKKNFNKMIKPCWWY